MTELDWKSEEDYAFTTGLTNAEWAWEFLRRLPNYRADWINANDQQEKFSKHQKGNKFIMHENPFVIFDPPIPQGVSPNDWVLRENVKRYAPLRGYGSKWRLQGLIQDPALPSPPKFERIASAKLLDLEELGHYFHSVAPGVDVMDQSGNIAVIGIDLTRSLAAIEADVKELAKAEYKKRKLDRVKQRDFKKTGNWQLFLRILDAMSAGESQATIGKFLLQTKPDAHEAKAAINRHINNDIPRFANPDELVRLANTPD